MVLVRRVCTGRSGALKFRHRIRNNDPFPLPLLMTIPVSFEHCESSLSAGAGVNALAQLPVMRPRGARDLADCKDFQWDRL
jgi:hypothetical protein